MLRRYDRQFSQGLSGVMRWYERIFSVSEITRESVLQWMFGASLLYMFLIFSQWDGKKILTAEGLKSDDFICWPYFQNCDRLYFLHGFPYGYAAPFLYMCFYGIMCLIIYCAWKKQWGYAHILFSALLIWKTFVNFFLTYITTGPYDYYYLILTAVLLFVPYKTFFLKLSFVFMYFMSVTVKFTPAWELGTYFTSMRSGLPLFPVWSTIFLTNLVIFMQIVDCWFLMSRNMILQRISFVYAAVFHLYSGVLVYYTYPTSALLPVLILFGPHYSYTPIPFSRKAVAGWIIIVLIALFQLLGFVVSPDRYLTLEGHRYGMFMFEANHQCLFTVTTRSLDRSGTRSWSGLACTTHTCQTSDTTASENGITIRTQSFESASSWYRCDPYETWFEYKRACDAPGIERISLQFDHSINGGPFYRIVDEADICSLTYKAFSHNAWIKVPPEAPIVGYPVQNFYSLPTFSGYTF